jgi:hypothetical protein
MNDNFQEAIKQEVFTSILQAALSTFIILLPYFKSHRIQRTGFSMRTVFPVNDNFKCKNNYV